MSRKKRIILGLALMLIPWPLLVGAYTIIYISWEVGAVLLPSMLVTMVTGLFFALQAIFGWALDRWMPLPGGTNTFKSKIMILSRKIAFGFLVISLVMLAWTLVTSDFGRQGGDDRLSVSTILNAAFDPVPKV